MATMLYRKQRAEIGFAGLMTTILTCDKKHENRSRKVEDCQLQALLDEDDIPIAKNACRAIRCFSNSHFHAAICHGEGSKNRKMGTAR